MFGLRKRAERPRMHAQAISSFVLSVDPVGRIRLEDGAGHIKSYGRVDPDRLQSAAWRIASENHQFRRAQRDLGPDTGRYHRWEQTVGGILAGVLDNGDNPLRALRAAHRPAERWLRLGLDFRLPELDPLPWEIAAWPEDESPGDRVPLGAEHGLAVYRIPSQATPQLKAPNPHTVRVTTTGVRARPNTQAFVGSAKASHDLLSQLNRGGLDTEFIATDQSTNSWPNLQREVHIHQYVAHGSGKSYQWRAGAPMIPPLALSQQLKNLAGPAHLYLIFACQSGCGFADPVDGTIAAELLAKNVPGGIITNIGRIDFGVVPATAAGVVGLAGQGWPVDFALQRVRNLFRTVEIEALTSPDPRASMCECGPVWYQSLCVTPDASALPTLPKLDLPADEKNSLTWIPDLSAIIAPEISKLPEELYLRKTRTPSFVQSLLGPLAERLIARPTRSRDRRPDCDLWTGWTALRKAARVAEHLLNL